MGMGGLREATQATDQKVHSSRRERKRETIQSDVMLSTMREAAD
jgi:hypothetical protein